LKSIYSDFLQKSTRTTLWAMYIPCVTKEDEAPLNGLLRFLLHSHKIIGKLRVLMLRRHCDHQMGYREIDV
jgi:hypothetical protein